MSTENRTFCPECERREQDKYEKDKAKLELLYGKLSPDEYIKRNDKLQERRALRETFQQCFAVYLQDGFLIIRYRGNCTKHGCGCVIELDKNVRISEKRTIIGTAD